MSKEIENRVVAVSLTMSRVPLNLFKEFKELADSEFCGDYGMTLKFIWEERKRLLQFYDLVLKFEKLKEEVEKLKGGKNAGKV